MKQNWLSRFRAGLSKAIASFSVTERIIFYLFLAVFIASGILAIWNVNSGFLVEVPESGGTLTEGIVGSPRFVNPVIAFSDADRDVISLVYSGLVRSGPDGQVIPDLAESYTVSDNGLTYTFKIRPGAKFQDGKPVTADDVEFTIQKIQDPSIKSSHRPAWEGVLVKKISDTEISFTLKQPYSPFIENLTIGILPKHLWKNISADDFSFSDLNASPIGSGPYKMKNVKRNSLGLPLYYDLVSSKTYIGGEPHISHIILKFYQNEKELVAAYEDGEVESLSGISPQYAANIDTERSEIIKVPLARVFGVFFNQNQAGVLVNKEVRQALDAAIDKESIVREVLGGFGQTTNDPIFVSVSAAATTTPAESSHTDIAIGILAKNGWALNSEGIMEKTVKKDKVKLAFSLSTGSAPELNRAAQMIVDAWRKIGADVDIQVFETGDLNQSVIRPRKYDALFFGEVVGRDFDLYPFWHSSQRNDPGLNIALYTNIKSDKILEDIRTAKDREARKAKVAELVPLIYEDRPAAFVYSPDFIYVVPKKLHSIQTEQITNTYERFTNIGSWYIDTNKVWKIFSR